jgi:hypothetical protein
MTGIFKYAELLMTRDPLLTRDEAVERVVLVLTGQTKVPADLMSPAQRKAARAAEKSKKEAKNRVPEHVYRNIARVRAAEVDRQKTGGTLPTATFVSGGKISTK